MRWTDEAMRVTMDLIKSGKSSMLHAAKLYGIPNSTLHDRISGKILHGQKPGHQRYFSAAEENEMANFCRGSEAGYEKTITQVQNIAEMAAHDKGKVESSVVEKYHHTPYQVKMQSMVAISSLEKTVDVPSEEVSDKQPPVELEHEKTLPNQETSVEITTKTSAPDTNNEDTENGGEL